MRRIFFLLLVFQSALCFSQTYNVDILNARKRIFLAGYAVDTVQNDTSFLYHVRSIPTSDAIARYMAGHGGGGGSKTIKQLLDENGSIGANNGFYYSGNGAIGSFGLNNVSPYMNYSRNGVVSTVRTGSDSFFLSTSYNGVLRSYIAGDTARVTLQGPVVNLLGINRGAPPTAKVMLRDTITGQVWYYDFLSPNGLAHTGTADWYVFARPDGTQRASQTLPDGLYSKFRNVGDGDSTMRQNPNDSLSFDLKSIKFDSPSGSIAFTKDTATDKNFYHVDAVESDPTVSSAVKTLDVPNVVMKTATQDISNKRYKPLFRQITDSSQVTLNCASDYLVHVTALAQSIQVRTVNTPYDGQRFLLVVENASSAQAMSWTASFRGTLPTTTIAGDIMYIGIAWNKAKSVFDVVRDPGIPATVVQTNQANTYGAGLTQVVQADGTYAGFGFGGTTSDPTNVSTGNMWYRSDIGAPRMRDGSTSRTFVMDNLSQLLTNKNLASATNIFATSTTGTTSSSTQTVTGDSRMNELQVNGLTVNTTIGAPTGTPANNNKIVATIVAAGSVTVSFNAIFLAVDVTVPPLVNGDVLVATAVYNSYLNKWLLVSAQKATTL